MSFESIFTFLRLKKVPWIALLSTANFEQILISSHFANFEQFKKHSSHFANFEQVKKYSSHFANFEQVISHFADFEQVIIVLLTLNKS